MALKTKSGLKNRKFILNWRYKQSCTHFCVKKAHADLIKILALLLHVKVQLNTDLPRMQQKHQQKPGMSKSEENNLIFEQMLQTQEKKRF